MATPTPTPARRRATRTAPPARVAYTRHATPGNNDDRVTANALVVFYKIMAWAGGVAILVWILFGGFQLGKASASIPATRVVERVRIIERPVPTTPRSRWASREDCERHYMAELHEAPGNRCR